MVLNTFQCIQVGVKTGEVLSKMSQWNFAVYVSPSYLFFDIEDEIERGRGVVQFTLRGQIR